MSFAQRLHPAVIALIARECKGQQRTLAWFLFRGKMLTASEMAAALGIDKYKSRKQLMKQKLRPVKIQSGDSIACAWGNKYEDEAVAKYERVTGRKVLPFSLIQHPKYTWLGASPDGVSVVENDPTAEPVGLEIKCPFSRELSKTGIPDMYFPQVHLLPKAAAQCTLVGDEKKHMTLFGMPCRFRCRCSAWISRLCITVSTGRRAHGMQRSL